VDSILDDDFNQSCIFDVIIGKSILAKRFDMEPDRGCDICDRLIVRVAFAHDYTPHADRVCYIAGRVFFDEDLERGHGWGYEIE